MGYTKIDPEYYEQKAMQLFAEGYNCSQAVVGAFEDLTKLDLQTSLRLASSFGGGMGRMREVCGAVSGMFIVAGILYGYSDPTNASAKTNHYKLIQDLAKLFSDENSSIICRELLTGVKTSEGHTPEARTEGYYKKRPCKDLVGFAAKILAEYIAKN